MTSDEWENVLDLDLEKMIPKQMNNVYDYPAYAEVREELHQKLEDLRMELWGFRFELNQKYLKAYMEHRERNKQAIGKKN